MHLHGRNPTINGGAKRQIVEGIRDLDAVTDYNPRNWAAYWYKGKGFQVMGDQSAANSSFKDSFAIQKENPDVAREYAASCLELGLGQEAVTAAEHALALQPANAGLHANLALALLISGRNLEARESIGKALEMDPADQISVSVKKIIDEVISGKRAQPQKLSDVGRR